MERKNKSHQTTPTKSSNFCFSTTTEREVSGASVPSSVEKQSVTSVSIPLTYIANPLVLKNNWSAEKGLAERPKIKTAFFLLLVVFFCFVSAWHVPMSLLFLSRFAFALILERLFACETHLIKRICKVQDDRGRNASSSS